MTVVADDFDRLDNVRVLKRGTDAKLGGDLFVIFAFRLSWFPLSEFLDGVDRSAVLRFALDESDGAASAGSEDFAPLSVLFGHGGMRRFLQTLMGGVTAAASVKAGGRRRGQSVGHGRVVVTMVRVGTGRTGGRAFVRGRNGSLRAVLVFVDLREAEQAPRSMFLRAGRRRASTGLAQVVGRGGGRAKDGTTTTSRARVGVVAARSTSWSLGTRAVDGFGGGMGGVVAVTVREMMIKEALEVVDGGDVALSGFVLHWFGIRNVCGHGPSSAYAVRAQVGAGAARFELRATKSKLGGWRGYRRRWGDLVRRMGKRRRGGLDV